MSKVPEFEKVKCESPDLAKQNLEKLKALFPGVVTEGPDGVVIDVEALKQECSAKPIEGNVERYEFTWPGKRAAKAAASTPTNKTLRPCRAESVNFDTTENLYIEGDNLEVLKLLQTNYAGKVKMIYIDPPYNTGHDFVYRDRFSLTQKELESDAGAFDDDGNRFEVNDSSEARYHSNWCSMMYPRLKLARQLLRDDGIIFISIDDHEVSNLITLCDSIFGQSNRVGIIHRRKNRKPHNAGVTMSLSYEFVVAYYKVHTFKLVQEFAEMHQDERGSYAVYPVVKGGKKIRTYVIKAGTRCELDIIEKRVYKAGKNSDLDVEYLDSTEIVSGRTKNDVRLSARYCLTDENGKFSAAMKDDNIYINSNGFPKEKRYRTDEDGKVDNHHWDIEKGKNEDADEEIEALFGKSGLFSYPKPTALVCKAMASASLKDEIVLDFFSGSATTAHAVMQLNAEDGGSRKYILVQLPEPCAEDSEAAKAGYKNICEIGKERIRRAGKKIAEANATTAPNLDIGFRVLKLDSSSLEDASETASGTQQQTLGLSRIKEDRTSEDLLFQILLESKLSLSDKIEKKKVEGNEVFFVSDTALVACLDAKAKMTEKFFTALAKFHPALAFFRDDLFESDSARINLAQIFKQFSPNTTITVI